MTDKPLECAMCGLAVYNEPPTVWSRGPDRTAYCDDECLDLATAVDHEPSPATDRATCKAHSMCGWEPCSDCR